MHTDKIPKPRDYTLEAPVHEISSQQESPVQRDRRAMGEFAFDPKMEDKEDIAEPDYDVDDL